MKLVVAITGSSSVALGIKFLKYLPKKIDVFLVISSSAKLTLSYEMKNYKKNIPSNITICDDKNLAQNISSGSFGVDCMIVLPCSMNTLAKCSVGISDTLITRVFSVLLKENKKIVLAPREMPFNVIQLENMTKLSKLGVSIAPPVLGYYGEQQTLEDMEKFLIGKWYDIIGIKNDLYKRWK